MGNKSPSLSVVIIAYNEELSLGRVVDHTISIISSNWDVYEIIIVDDGSTDDTAKVANQLVSENDSVLLLQNSKRKGVGGALKTGFAKVQCDYATWLPADGQIAPREILKFWPRVKQADLVLSSYNIRPDAKSRLFISKTLRKLMRVILDFRFEQEGIYLFNTSILKSIDLKIDSMIHHFELSLKAHRLGFKIDHIFIDCLPRISGQSKVANLQTIHNAFLDILRLRLDLLRFPRNKGIGRVSN